MQSISMENLDFQSHFKMKENTEFEEKVDIDDLVLSSKPAKMAEIEIIHIKEKPLEEQHAAFESDQDRGKKFKLKLEENILQLCEELDKEKSVNSMVDFSLRKSIIIRQFVEKIAEYDPLKKYLEIKPFSCKFCDKSFLQVNEVKEHIKIHNSISEVEDLRKQLKYLKTQVEELQMKLKSSQSKMASSTNEKMKPKSTHDAINLEKLKIKGKKDYQCGSCEKKFTSTYKLKRHGKIHETKSGTNEVIKEFKCHICDMGFIMEEYVKRHIKSVHDEKQHKCNLCDYETSSKSHLTRHQKSKHLVEELEKGEDEEIVSEGMPGFQERKRKIKESFKVKADLANAKNFKIRYKKPDGIEEAWGKDLEEELGKDKTIISEGLPNFQERKRRIKESLEVKSSRPRKCKRDI